MKTVVCHFCVLLRIGKKNFIKFVSLNCWYEKCRNRNRNKLEPIRQYAPRLIAIIALRCHKNCNYKIATEIAFACAIETKAALVDFAKKSRERKKSVKVFVIILPLVFITVPHCHLNSALRQAIKRFSWLLINVQMHYWIDAFTTAAKKHKTIDCSSTMTSSVNYFAV